MRELGIEPDVARAPGQDQEPNEAWRRVQIALAAQTAARRN